MLPRRREGTAFAAALLFLGCGSQAHSRVGDQPRVEFAEERAERQNPAASEEVAEAERALEGGEIDRAVSVLERYLEGHSDDRRALLDLGLAYELLAESSQGGEQSGALDRAERAYRRAVELDPEFAVALNNLGGLLRNSERTEEAIGLLERAVTADPSNAASHSNLAMAYEDATRDQDAEREYRQAIRLAPEDSAPRTSLGLILLRRGDRSAALGELREALPRARGNRAELAAIGNGLRRAGDPQLAVQAMREALELEPGHRLPGLRSEYALALYAGGERERAVAEIRALVRELPSYPDAHWVFGNMLAAEGDRRGAVTEYETFIRLAPDAPQASEARERITRMRRPR